MKLETWMKKNNETYRSLAKKIGDINHTSLFKYGTGERTPRLKTALKIEKVTKGQVKCSDLVSK